MKKVIIGFVILVALFFTVVPDALVWCKQMILDAPTTHQINKGEYLSKISQQYYGSAKYWRELALINRAPDSDLVFPGEEIFIPSREVIELLHRSRSLSRVNSLMNDERDVYANAQRQNESIEMESKSTAAKMAHVPADSKKVDIAAIPASELTKIKVEPQAASFGGSLIMALIAGVLLLGVVGLVVYRKIKNKREREELQRLTTGDSTSQSVEDDDEPDYEEYRKNRNDKVYV
ncbi:MAG: LysM peptidoglycan-binding domain-containing protein [Methanosarcinaceae archaeon]